MPMMQLTEGYVVPDSILKEFIPALESAAGTFSLREKVVILWSAARM